MHPRLKFWQHLETLKNRLAYCGLVVTSRGQRRRHSRMLKLQITLTLE
jgi:hypothetical protein